MSEPIVYTFKTDGAQQVAAAIKANNDALKSAERETRAAAKAADQLFKSNSALTRQRVSEEFKRQAQAAKEVAAAEREAQRAADALFKTNAALSRQKLSEEFKRQAQAAKDLADAQQKAGIGAAALAGTISLAGKSFIESAIDARVEYEGLLAALNSATQGQGEEAFAFINREVDRLRINLPAATSAFTQLSAAARGTILEGQGVEEIFSAVAQAGRVNNQSLEKQRLTYKAITDVIGKGVLQQEELRGQLSEALPGAAQVFARALGVSTAELNKLIKAGEVGLPELLLFAKQLESETAGSVEEATQTLGASFDQLSTEINRFQVNTGEVLSPFAKGVADSASAVLSSFNALSPAFQQLILVAGGLTTAFVLLTAAQIANKQLGITATAVETAKAIALRASTVATTALATSNAILARVTGTATAAQLAQVSALAAGAAKAGLFAAAIGSAALAFATFNNATGAGLETNQAIEDITASLNRLKEATAVATQGTAQGFANATAAVEANKKAIEDSIPIYFKAVDAFLNLVDAIDPADIGSNAEAAVAAQRAAFSGLTSQIENDVVTVFDRLKDAPGGLAAATDAELSALADSIETATSALEKDTPTTEENLAAKTEYLELLGQLQTELTSVTGATGEGTDALKEQTDALKEFREQAKQARQDQFDAQNLQADRQREDAQIEEDRARADELAKTAKENAEEIAQIEQTNAEANAELERANAEEIAQLQERNAADLAEQQRVAQEQEGQLEQRQQDELQRREQAFNRQQQSIEDQFQRQQQSEQESFNRAQRDAQQEFSDRQNDEREKFEERIGNRRTDIERQIQLEFADSQEEQRRLQREFADEDAREKRRTQLENGGGGFSTGQTFAEIGGTFEELQQNQQSLADEEKSFEEQQREEQAKFEQEQRLAQEQFEDAQRLQEVAFNKIQQDTERQFQESQLALKTAQEAQLQALRVANEGILAGIREQQEVALLAVKVAQEEQLKTIREQQERDLQALRDQLTADALSEQRSYEDEQRRLDREQADEQRRVEAEFKETQRGLDVANAQTIAGILGSVTGAPERTVAGRRTGGPVDGSTPYMVGEAGPELFVPKQSGYVLNRPDTLRVMADQQYQPPAIRMPSTVSQSINQNGMVGLLQEVRRLRRDLGSVNDSLTAFKRPEQIVNINEPEDTMNRRLYQVIRAGAGLI